MTHFKGISINIYIFYLHPISHKNALTDTNMAN